ncbi:MAG: nucleotidyltransferase domain-containing protein [Nanoarchaeota archaeon]
MKIKSITDKLDIIVSELERKKIKDEMDVIVNALKDEIRRQKVDADVFVGGSFAKGTIVNKKEHDVDIFVRFGWEYVNLSEKLDKIVKNAARKLKLSYVCVHGSRDYFRIKKDLIYFEIIPVLRIKKPGEARNVTDLSYFHVNYVIRKMNKNIAKEIAIAKTFCKAHGVYGAESYIQGFSGYGLECLIIYYKSFEKMLKALIKVENRMVIDPEKKYKNKDEVVINLNESKLHSPIVLVDPTWKERNVLAALNIETFKKFQKSAKAFLKNPTIEFFKDKEIDVDAMKKDAKKNNAEFVSIDLKTDKQAGDIAGTKLKKFSDFISLEIGKYFTIIRKEFFYNDIQSAKSYFVLKRKKDLTKIGPPVEMKDACKAFRKANKNTFEKNGMLHAKIVINHSAKRFLQQWKEKYAKKVKEMDITEIDVN